MVSAKVSFGKKNEINKGQNLLQENILILRRSDNETLKGKRISNKTNALVKQIKNEHWERFSKEMKHEFN